MSVVGKDMAEASRSDRLHTEIEWLARHRAADARALVRAYKRMTRGGRAQHGTTAAYFVSLLEVALRGERARKRRKAARLRAKARPG
jgi:hypothetical protein